MPQGTITADDADFVETWENVSQVQNYIIRLDTRGDDKPELIQGPRQFYITTAERLITQERIFDPHNDPFVNGCFRPIKVPNSINIETNPNALSDQDIANILRSSKLAWDEYMKVVDSPATLRRFLDVAQSMIEEEEDVSALRLDQVRKRLAEVEPRPQIVQRDRTEYERLADTPSPQATGGSGRKSIRSRS